MERDEDGTFTFKKQYGGKTQRNMRLSDYAWDKLGHLAEQTDCTRTDIIEEFVRGDISEQEVVLKALEKFIEGKKADWGSNGSQKGEFNPSSRTWDIFNQFKKLVEQSPWEMGIGEEENI
jgi:predicted transcriptional regulator